MESPTIRKVRACFGEAKKQLFSPIQECLILFLLLCQWLPATSTASLATSAQSTQPDYRLCFTGNLVNVVVSSCSFSMKPWIHVGSKNSNRWSDR